MTNRAFSVYDSRLNKTGQSFKPRPFGNDLLNRRKFTGVLSNAKTKAKPDGKKPANGETSHGSEFAAKQLAGISQMHTKHLAASASGDLDLDQCAKDELRERGLDPKGKWTGVKEPKEEEAKGARDYAQLRDDPGFTFDKLGTDVLSAAATGRASLNDMAKHELSYRGLDSKGTYIGTTAARAHHFPKTKLEEAEANKRKADAKKQPEKKGKTKNRFEEMIESARALKNSGGIGESTIPKVSTSSVSQPHPNRPHGQEVTDSSLEHSSSSAFTASMKALTGEGSHKNAEQLHGEASDKYMKASDGATGENKKRYSDMAEKHSGHAQEHALAASTGVRPISKTGTARIDSTYIKTGGNGGTATFHNSYSSIIDSIRNRLGTGIHCALFSGDALQNHRFALPADGYIQIVPKGEHPHPSGVVQVCDDEALDAMVKEFHNNARKPNFPGVLLDYDHMSQDSDKYSNAAGWLSDLQKRSDGLWAKANWSTSGEQAVRGGEYRFVSPVWNRSECAKLDGNRLRPLKLDTVALTNDPNIGWKRGANPITK